jgi:hypothetical protein
MMDVSAAVAQRYNSTDLATALNGLFVGTAWPNTDRPYAVLMPLTDTPSGQTNKAKYRAAVFTADVMADDYDTATRLAYLLHERLTKPPLEFSTAALPWAVPAGRMIRLSEGTFRWIEEDQFWRVVVEFTANVTRP